eukprot:19148-Heterococcus_DN1.PRE.2
MMQLYHVDVATCIHCALHTLVQTNCKCLCCYHLHTEQYVKARAVADKIYKARRTSTATAATRRGTNATENGTGDDPQQQEVQALEDGETEPISAASLSWAARALLTFIVLFRTLCSYIKKWHLAMLIIILGLAITVAACNKLWRPSARAAAVAAPGNNDDNQGGGGGNGHNGHDAPPPPPANDDNNNNNDHHNAGAGG